MMNYKETVAELMLPLSEYAIVDAEATLVDALHALDEAQEKRPHEQQPHRAVLVRDKKGRIIGKLGHFAFLKALLLRSEHFFDDPVLSRAGVSDDMVQISKSRLNLYGENMSMLCGPAQYVKVKDVMRPATFRIAERASLQDAMKLFVDHQTLSLLVIRGREVVGILRLADLFDELARYVKQSADDES